MCKECKGCKEFANGNKMSYSCFEELTDDLKKKFQSKAKGIKLDDSKKAYVDFINKLNKNGDELLSDYVNATTKVRIHYGKCSHEHPEGKGVKPNNYKSGKGCGICHGFIVVEGDNDLATKCPDLAKEWHPTKNGDLKPTRVTCGSGREVWWLCLDCGYEWEATIANRISNDTKCPNCGDGISYPEKLMAIILDKLNIEYTRQLTYDNGKHKYDFYIKDWGANGVINETHGRQHYEQQRRKGARTLEEEQDNDKYKKGIAINNYDIVEEDYNEIDCRYSTLEWCKPNIEKALSKYIDINILTDEDWQEADVKAQKSKKIEACLYWKEQKETNKDLTTTIMAEIFNVNKATIIDWLTWGNERGLCIYNSEEERKAKERRQSKFVYLIKPDGTKWYDEAMSQKELARLTGISECAIGLCRIDGKPLVGGNRAKYDSKYIGSYVVEEDKLEEFLLNLKGGDIIE